MRAIVLLLAATCLCTDVAAKRKCLQVVEAYSQRVLPGIRQAQVTANTHIIVVWKGPKHPDAFMWFGDNGWQNCKATLACTPARHEPVSGTEDYVDEAIAMNRISRNDTLDITSINGAPAPAPAGKPGEHTLWVKIGNDWQAFAAGEIKKKHDIALP